ncbi:unnamed protein product [Protopolystoma xenopodis]|uniref:Uncharacterized protein n=1 Tax=Protopolystoma xenopodis TaxID=117903 RepID=A0A448WLI2_9PLAT|nr:unnamed protein product [Protopolystoma xenopodis]
MALWEASDRLTNASFVWAPPCIYEWKEVLPHVLERPQSKVIFSLTLTEVAEHGLLPAQLGKPTFFARKPALVTISATPLQPHLQLQPHSQPKTSGWVGLGDCSYHHALEQQIMFKCQFTQATTQRAGHQKFASAEQLQRNSNRHGHGVGQGCFVGESVALASRREDECGQSSQSILRTRSACVCQAKFCKLSSTTPPSPCLHVQQIAGLPSIDRPMSCDCNQMDSVMASSAGKWMPSLAGSKTPCSIFKALGGQVPCFTSTRTLPIRLFTNTRVVLEMAFSVSRHHHFSTTNALIFSSTLTGSFSHRG